MALVVTAEPDIELLSIEDAKLHLRVYSGDLDSDIEAKIRAARDYCERFTQRTLRESVARTLTLDKWWTCEQKLPWPPLLTVEGITYYDAANVSQTLSSTNYIVEQSTNGGGRIVWAQTATIPSTYTRPDAITIEFTAGYADATALPPVVLEAMKTKLTELWGSGSDNETKAAMNATDRLLGMVDWTGYA